MRSLRSARKLTTSTKPTENIQQDENNPSKMCQKQNKSTKVTTKNTRRPVLADKTNSASDINESLSPDCGGTNALKTRPKRNQQIPIRYLDHELSPILIRNKDKPRYSSTPVSTKPVKSKVLQSKQNKNSSNAKDLNALLTNQSAILNKKRCPNTASKESHLETAKITNTRSRKAAIIPALATTTVASSPSKYSFINRSKTFNNSSVTVADKGNKTSDGNVIVSGKATNAAPIYKRKLSLNSPNKRSIDRLALYEFELDPTEPAAKPVKKQVRKKAQPRKKKLPVSKNDDADMKSLLEQLKKIQAAALLKKLAAKKKHKQDMLKISQTVLPPPIKAVEVNHDKQITSEEIHDQFFKNAQPSTSYDQNSGCIPVPNERELNFISPQSPAGSVFADDLPNDYHEVVESNFSSDNALKSSFFTDIPVASSSMIHGDPKPAASPWRVNYDSEQKKWPYNFHVKASMTPSYQRDTFHVLGLDDKNPLIEVEETGQNQKDDCNTENGIQHNISEANIKNLKQTSILSFYEESLKKTTKKTVKTSTENYSYEEYLATLPSSPLKKDSNDKSQASSTESTSSDQLPPDSRTEAVKEKPALENCFGFDDIDENDQENISPNIKAPKLKNINVIRGGGIKKNVKKAVLKEINQIPSGPTRVNTRRALNAIAIKESHIEKELEKELAEVIVEKDSIFMSNDSSSSNQEDESVPETSEMVDSENTTNNVALFEDPFEPEFVHFNKPSRRSYEIRKRPHVKFNIEKGSDSEHSIDEDYDNSLNPAVVTKKVTKKHVKRKKNVKTKKENKEADEWAAGFNSMLEEVDEFTLCVE